MEKLHNGFTLDTPAGTFPLSTDSILLSHFAQIRKQDSVLDLGAGCGTLGLLLCAKNPDCQVTGIELDSASHEAAVNNIEANHLVDRMKSICADLRTIHSFVKAGSFHVCVSNPPYYSGGPASNTTPLARRNDLCELSDLFSCAAWALRFGGDFYLVHKPEALAQLCACAVQAGLEPKKLQLVRHKPHGEVSLILLKCRKGAKPGLEWDSLCLFHDDGTPTEEYKTIYHL